MLVSLRWDYYLYQSWNNYPASLSCGVICASGTLGQIIPPSLVLILLADVLSSAFQQAQLNMGIFSPETVTIADLFAGAIIPGIILPILYIIYLKSASIEKQTLESENIIKKSEYEDIDSWLSDNITHSPEFFDELCNEIDFNDRKDKYLLYETAILDKYICKWYSHLDITSSFLRLGYIEG